MRDQEVFAALNQHWAASDSGNFATEHDIYQEDAFLDYPQSRARIVERQNIQITRSLPPSKKRFSIMELRGVKVAHETQYFADPFEAGEWHKKWAVSMDTPKDQGRPEGAIADARRS